MQHPNYRRVMIGILALMSVAGASCGTKSTESAATVRAQQHAAQVAAATRCDLSKSAQTQGSIPGKSIGCVSLVARVTKGKQLAIVGATWSGTEAHTTGAIDDVKSCGIDVAEAGSTTTKRANTRRGCMRRVELSHSPQLNVHPAALRSSSTITRTARGTYTFSIAGVTLPKGYGLTHGSTIAASSGTAMRVNSTAEDIQGIGVSFPGKQLQPVGTFYTDQKLVDLRPGTLIALRAFVTPLS